MSADPFYEVTEHGCSMLVGGPHFTFADAERRARWYAARHNRRYDIDLRTPTRRHGTQRETVATVIRDALGRIWTDVQSMDGLI